MVRAYRSMMSARRGFGALWLAVLAECGPTPAPVTGIAGSTSVDSGCNPSGLASRGECRSDVDCASGQGCLEGRCLEIPGYCDRDHACQAGLVCRANRCSVCLDDHECEDGYECENGLCRPWSVCLDFCSTGEPCINGLCRPISEAGVVEPTSSPVVGPPADRVTRAQAWCESGRAAFDRGDAKAAIPALDDGIALLEPLGLELTAETGGDVLAACLYDLGRAREVASSDEPWAQPEVLYGRSLALRPDNAVAARLRSRLRENGGEECTIGDVSRTESAARVFQGWACVAEALSAEVDSSGGGRGFADEAAALDFLFGDRAGSGAGAPSEAAVATVGDGDQRLTFLLVPRPDGTVLVPDRLASAMGGRCPSEADGWLAGASPLHAIGFESSTDSVYEDEDGHPCESEDEHCMSGCVWVSHRVTHLFIDPESGRTVTITVQVEGLDPVGDGEPCRYAQVQPFDGRLVLFGCGTRMESEP